MGVFSRLLPGTRLADDPAPHDLLNIVTERGPAVVWLRVRGEVDLYTVPLLRAALTQSVVGDAETVVIDLSEVTFMASSGLRALMDGLDLARRRRCELRLAGQPAAVRRLIEAAGLRGVFPGD